MASNKIPDVYYMHLTLLSADIRGGGIGTQVWNHAKEIALQYGIHKIEYRCPASNTKAIEFYKRLGYVQTDSFKDELSGGETDLYFQLKFH